MPSSTSATHRAGHGSNRSAASTAKTGTSSVWNPGRGEGAGDFDDLARRRDQRRSGAQFVDGPERVGCAVRNTVGTLMSGRVLVLLCSRQKRCPVQRSLSGRTTWVLVAVPNAALRHLPNRITFRLVASAHTMEGPEFSQDREGSGR